MRSPLLLVASSLGLVLVPGALHLSGGCASSPRPVAPAAQRLNDRGVELLHLRASQPELLEDAEASLRLAIEYHPRFAEAQLNLGIVLMARGQMVEAGERIETAIALDEDFAEAWMARGVWLRAEGEVAGSEAAFAQALSIDPGLVRARMNLALSMIDRNALEDARSHLLRLTQVDSAPPAAWAWLAWVELRLDRPHSAERAAERAIALDAARMRDDQVPPPAEEEETDRGQTRIRREPVASGAVAPAHLVLARLALERGDLSRAAHHAERARESAATREVALTTLAWVAIVGGDPAEARRQVEALSRFAPGSDALVQLRAAIPE